ncbi:MAG: hypothetical protein WBG73_00845 [Coleofasciculaceae cyanobacterium]
MQNPSTDRYTMPNAANKYSPSVPITVYRELAAELQAAQTTIDSLRSQNQQLVKQNQQLQQQVEKVVHSAQHLQQIVSSFSGATATNHVEIPRYKPARQPEPQPMAPPPPPHHHEPRESVFDPASFQDEPEFSPYAETVVIEQEDTRVRRPVQSESVADVNGWMLIIAILLIVLTAFGTGFLIVRPLLNNNKR